MAAEPLALDTIVFARGLTTPPGVKPELSGISLDVLPGEIFSIVGRAGSGKTTLLEALIGMRPALRDTLQVCGHDPRRVPEALRQRIGVALAHAEFERKITVEEALRLAAGFYDRSDPQRALAQLRLEPVRHRQIESLPAPMRQRVSLAAALINDPAVLFADEPTHEMDPEGTRLVFDLLRERRDRGRTSVIATNHLEEAARLSDRIAVLERGRLVAVDTPAALIRRSRAPVRVTFEVTKPDVPLDALLALDAVIDARLDRTTYVLTSRDGHATLRAVLRMLDRLQLRPLAVGLRQQALEDVFFEMIAAGEADA
ncbi:MAG: ABC transporter ATP-binding protein [Vicinamibacterales bacterium]